MEKYRNSADPGTGIHPFMPVVGKGNFVSTWVLGSLLVLARLPMVVVVSGIVMISALVSSLLSLVAPSLGNWFEAVTVRPSLRLILFLCGFPIVMVQPWPLTAHTEEPFTAQPGDVILVNFTGYMDVVIQASLRGALFAFAQDYKGKPLVVTKGPIGAFRYAVQSYQETKTSFDETAGTLAAACKKARAANRPLVLFFEGTATNGRGMLACPPGLVASSDSKNTAFHLQAHVHHHLSARSKPRASAVYPISDYTSPMGHLIRLISVPSHYLRIISVLPSATPSFSAYPDASLLQRHLLQTLSEASGLKLMAKVREDKAPFLQHWRDTQGSDYAKE
ncbi:putative lysophosphatidic acid:oleoyl-CoA acyltransferase [Diplonema papillatum]|nr:putative lysophosphatidic acid:oleoyl-CoA acyltransferase [Diplonema papillatum]